MFTEQEKDEFMAEVAAQQLIAAIDPERRQEAEILQALAAEPAYIEPTMIGSIAAFSVDMQADFNLLTSSIAIPSRERLFGFIQAVIHPQGRLMEEMLALAGGEIGKTADDIMISARRFCDSVSESPTQGVTA